MNASRARPFMLRRSMNGGVEELLKSCSNRLHRHALAASITIDRQEAIAVA